ncbi:MAG: 4Fe-4S binding protein [Anaerostipes sp.]|nr:4Fe-4S binding protein [Anaerostipes sp.]
MTAKDCLALLRKIKDAAFATVDEHGRPRVRIIDVMLVEEEKLYFCTARGKDFYRQLTAEKYTAVTGMNREYQMIRLSGPVKRLTDQTMWIDRIFDENPSMKELYPEKKRYILEAFCIEDAQLEFFDLGRNPVYREQFAIGTMTKEDKGFCITDSCTGCGACKEACPSQCIREGEPFEIQAEHCLHCGLCEEQCPAGAIQRKEG